MPRARRMSLLARVAAVVVSVVLAVSIVEVVGSDDATTDAPTPPPTTTSAGAPASVGGADGRVLAAGNALVVVRTAAEARAVAAFARSIGAEDAPAVRAAGQAIVIRVRPRSARVVARVGAQRLVVATIGDARLASFLDTGLGG